MFKQDREAMKTGILPGSGIPAGHGMWSPWDPLRPATARFWYGDLIVVRQLMLKAAEAVADGGRQLARQKIAFGRPNCFL